MASVAIAGRFEPGGVVELYKVGEGHARAEAGDLVDRRLADGKGDVGFTGLDAGRFIATGYLLGRHVELSVRSKEPGEGSELTQPPVKAEGMKMGCSPLRTLCFPPPLLLRVWRRVCRRVSTRTFWKRAGKRR